MSSASYRFSCVFLLIFRVFDSRLITDVKSLAAQNASQPNFIFLARLLKAIVEICRHVKQCLLPAGLLPSNTWIEQNPSNVEQWERVSRLLNEETLNLWKQWIDMFVNERLIENNGLCFAIDINLTNLLATFPNWDTLAIEEKDETNQAVESTIRVPSQPSIPLQQFLFACCRQLNSTVPNTLPKPVITLLTNQLIERLAFTYGEVIAKNPFISANQNASLQFYFDVKFLTLMFLDGRRNDALQMLTEQFKANVDPFAHQLVHVAADCGSHKIAHAIGDEYKAKQKSNAESR